MAGRLQGVSVSELMEVFGTDKWSTLRFVRRLVKQGIIRSTAEKRRRPEVYGARWPGAPVKVYRLRR